MASKTKYRIGIDLGGTKIEIIALNERNETLLRERLPTPRGQYQETIDTITDMIAQAESHLGEKATLGVCMPGSFSPATGLVRNANSTWLNGRAFNYDLSRRMGRELRFANDADCFALSEAIDGAAIGQDVVFGVILGTGVGGGIVVRGKLLGGHNGISGEWGHNPLPWLDPELDVQRACYCSRTGCIETFLAGPSMSWHHSERFGEQLSALEICQRSYQEDSNCLYSLGIYTDRLARSLASVINILDPNVIVLGGGMSNVDQLYRDTMNILPRYVFSDSVRTELRAPIHGDSGGVRGAAMLWDD